MPKSKANCLDPKTPKEDCTHEIRSKFTGRDILALGNGCMVSGDSNACGDPERIEKEDGGKFRLMYAAFHCHAPACISGELWNDDTGELICRNTAQCTPSKQPLPLSKSSARSDFLRPAASDGTSKGYEPMDEHAYVVGVPPCLWGSEAEGLRPPPVLSLDSNLTTIKRANSVK